MPAELGRAGVSQTHPLQPARQRRSLPGVGTAEALRGGAAHGVQITPPRKADCDGSEVTPISAIRVTSLTVFISVHPWLNFVLRDSCNSSFRKSWSQPGWAPLLAKEALLPWPRRA